MKIKKMSMMLTVICLCVILFNAGPLLAGKDALKNNWESISSYYLEAANLMPEEHFGFKPTKEVFSYAEQLLHIAGGNYYFASLVKGEKSPKPQDVFKAEGKSKKVIVALLKESFEFMLKAIAGFNDEKLQTKVDFAKKKMAVYQVLTFAAEHAIHHRGQMIVYLRLKGQIPPKYRSGLLK